MTMDASSAVWGWQGEMRSLQERNRHLLDCAPMSDVTFLVGMQSDEAVPVKAHRFILASGSLVFETMFYGSVPEPADQPVRVSDMDVDTFRSVLKYIYLGEVQIDWDSVFSLLYASRKYGMPVLTQKCVDYVVDNLTPENCVEWIAQIQKFDADGLVRVCLEVFDGWSPVLMKTESIAQVDAETVRLILERDSLLADEKDVYDAVERWSKAACLSEHVDSTPENRRKILGDLLYLVRYAAMAPADLMNGPAKNGDNGLLSKEEIYDIFQQRYTESEASTPFVKQPRCMGMLSRFHELQKGWTAPEYAVAFRADKPVKLVGLGLFGSDVEGWNGMVSAKVEICQAQHSGFNSVFPRSVLTSEEYSFRDFGWSEEPLFRKILLKKPIPVEVEVNYGVAVYFKDWETCWQGVNGKFYYDIRLKNGDEVKIQMHAFNPQGSYVFDETSEKRAYENNLNGQVAHLFFESP
ncbi:BTB/POZ domain-containing protein 2-like isoform X3 [Paramacrobiotus metropolitanus]|uniref:BTB/POZ domain-containing protein 2-like isoform X3 n=1 Tax=Paramacrobiotus metropolitanus TaxID=2943436 RepID=UPI002445E413|nr:BTB/POZ domain-containing protein 2-like isoform X3 [Paramacrobiotus metropolitanus]